MLRIKADGVYDNRVLNIRQEPCYDTAQLNHSSLSIRNLV
jgi:hypothetical protein